MAIGIDLVFIPRLSGKDDVAKRVLTDREYGLYLTRPNKAEFLAGRFAAKEAFLKAMPDAVGKIGFRSIEVTTLPDGQPVLSHAGTSYDISISHDGDYAIAICIINQ